jgi:hypothetical protein
MSKLRVGSSPPRLTCVSVRSLLVVGNSYSIRLLGRISVLVGWLVVRRTRATQDRMVLPSRGKLVANNCQQEGKRADCQTSLLPHSTIQPLQTRQSAEKARRDRNERQRPPRSS